MQTNMQHNTIEIGAGDLKPGYKYMRDGEFVTVTHIHPNIDNQGFWLSVFYRTESGLEGSEAMDPDYVVTVQTPWKA